MWFFVVVRGSAHAPAGAAATQINEIVWTHAKELDRVVYTHGVVDGLAIRRNEDPALHLRSASWCELPAGHCGFGHSDALRD